MAFTIRDRGTELLGKWVSGMNAETDTRMKSRARKRSNNWVITAESRNNQHQEIILSTIVKRAYQLFERRGYAHGFDLDDWIAAEKELLQNDFNGNTSQFDLFIESPRDPEVTTILSMSTHSMIVFSQSCSTRRRGRWWARCSICPPLSRRN